MSNVQLDDAAKISDRLKHLEQDRAFKGEQFFVSHRLHLEHSHAERIKCFDAIVLWGGNSVRSLFLLNGGAILAFITFTGSLIGKGDKEGFSRGIEFAQALLPAFYSFILGVCLAAAISGIAYLNFNAAFHLRPPPVYAWAALSGKEEEEQEEAPKNTALKIVNGTFILAATLAVASILSFVVGCIFVSSAIGSLEI